MLVYDCSTRVSDRLRVGSCRYQKSAGFDSRQNVMDVAVQRSYWCEIILPEKSVKCSLRRKSVLAKSLCVDILTRQENV